MKYAMALVFSVFLLVSVYLLMKYKTEDNVQAGVPQMLLRSRTGKISIANFKSDDKGTEYKVSEEMLDNFAEEVKDLKDKQKHLRKTK